MNSLVVVSWNLARNTTGKSMAVHERAWAYLAELDPAIALLQEVTIPNWARERWDVVAADVLYWGSAVLARPDLQLRAQPMVRESIWERDGYLTAGMMTIPWVGDLTLASVHAPVMKALTPDFLAGYEADVIKLANYPVAYYYDVPFALLQDVTTDRFLVSGDWNVSPDLWDRHHPRMHEADFFARAEAHGWVDCYRRFNDEEGRTWFRKRDRPYQLDHAFCDALTAERLVSCRIDATPAEELGLSDHAPLVLEFDAS